MKKLLLIFFLLSFAACSPDIFAPENVSFDKSARLLPDLSGYEVTLVPGNDSTVWVHCKVKNTGNTYFRSVDSLNFHFIETRWINIETGEIKEYYKNIFRPSQEPVAGFVNPIPGPLSSDIGVGYYDEYVYRITAPPGRYVASDMSNAERRYRELDYRNEFYFGFEVKAGGIVNLLDSTFVQVYKNRLNKP